MLTSYAYTIAMYFCNILDMYLHCSYTHLAIVEMVLETVITKSSEENALIF